MKYAELYRPRKRPHSEREDRLEVPERIDAAAVQAKSCLVVSHGHCLDGVGSAIMVLRAFKPGEVGVAYVQPSDMLEALDHLTRVPSLGRRLLIADLSLDPEHYDEIVDIVRRLASGGWRIEWRDHHHKQWEGLDLSLLQEHVRALEVNDDATESGASLMQDAVAKKDAFARRLAATIRDRDLWWNKDPDSEILEFAITWMGEDAFTEHMVAKGPNDDVVDDTIRRAAAAQHALIEEHTEFLLRHAMYFPTSRGDQVGVVYGWLPKNVGLHRLLQHDGVRLAINVRPNGKMSLRSRKDAPVAHLVARRFSGGGHPNASGGDLGLSGLAYRWYLLRHGKVARTYEVAEAAVDELDAMDAA